MAKNEKTSPRVAPIGSKGMQKPGALTKNEIRSVSASTVTQAPDKKTPSKKK